MARKVLITASLPYANGPLHFGHMAGAYLPADCYARFERSRGKEVLYVCGSDEHGVAVTLSAKLEGRSPREHVDLYHEVLKKGFHQFNISFDHYSRTTWEGHVGVVQEFFKDLLANGYIEEREVEQLYSTEDQIFLADRYVVGTCPQCGYHEARGDECQKCGAMYEAHELIDPRSKLSHHPLTKRVTNHWFLRFDLLKESLVEWMQKREWKSNVSRFAQHYIDHLKPRSITRDSEWGVSVPLERAKGKVFYVWFDAPIGYISATKEWAAKMGQPNLWKEYWCDSDTRLVQFIGKDNIPFHAILFPAMVMGQNQPYKLVDDLPANEFYYLESGKFSKSSKRYLDLDLFFEKFSVDQIRYALAANAPETQDGEFSWQDFQMRCNSELLGKYGNFVHRVLVFIQKQFEGRLVPLEKMEQEDQTFLQQIFCLVERCESAYSTFSLRKATRSIMELSELGNRYFDRKSPWKDIRDQALLYRAKNTLTCCYYALCALSLISHPVIPLTARTLWTLLGQSLPMTIGWEMHIDKIDLPTSPLPPPFLLFERVEDQTLQEEMNRLEQ